MRFFLLTLFARNLDSIIALFQKLDQQLDAYIAKEQAEMADLDDRINQLDGLKKEKAANAERAARIKTNLQ